MHFDYKRDRSGSNFVYIESLDKNIYLEDISNKQSFINDVSVYEIGIGDQIAVTVWSLQDVFPLANINPDQNFRKVDSNGNIYFPYVGEMKALD